MIGKLLLFLGALAVTTVIIYSIGTVIKSIIKKSHLNLKQMFLPSVFKVTKPVYKLCTKVVISSMYPGQIIFEKVLEPVYVGVKNTYFVKKSKKEKELEKEMENVEKNHKKKIDSFDHSHEFSDSVD